MEELLQNVSIIYYIVIAKNFPVTEMCWKVHVELLKKFSINGR